MSDGLNFELCPFCGQNNFSKLSSSETVIHKCRKLDEFIEFCGYGAIFLPVELWQSRPIEESLRREIASIGKNVDAMSNEIRRQNIELESKEIVIKSKQDEINTLAIRCMQLTDELAAERRINQDGGV
jgi:hypothetical protein